MRDPERGQRRRRVRERGRLDLFLFIGSFIIAEAMLVHGLDRRFAFNILSLRWVGSSTYRIIIAFGFIGRPPPRSCPTQVRRR
jgi:hypothetical protein